MMTSIGGGKFLASISSRGAELKSLKYEEKELLWQGKRGVWEDTAYNIFPIAGRLRKGRYTYRGKTYEMPLHGFAPFSEFERIKLKEDSAKFLLTENEATLACYPFRFAFTVEFGILSDGIFVRYTAENTGKDRMYCAFGAHPGFNLPLKEGTPFSGHEVVFSGKTRRLPLDRDLLQRGEPVGLDGNVFPLPEGGLAPANIFETEGTNVLLRARGQKGGIRVTFEGFPYVVLWSGDPALVCIEPWGSMTEDADGEGDLDGRKDLSALAAGQKITREWRIGLC